LRHTNYIKSFELLYNVIQARNGPNGAGEEIGEGRGNKVGEKGKKKRGGEGGGEREEGLGRG
jgi:hypothetical protein